MIKTENNTLLPSRTVTGWRIWIDYRKLNKATRKDHFPLLYLDHMLDRLAGHEYYCFLEAYSSYNQIAIALKDQEKTTFTCLYGTFAFRRMPFGLCNAPGTFQRCMMAIFLDMVEKTIEIFMDDFSVLGNSFNNCLENLRSMLIRCEETNLVLNWEKYHFMVQEGIILGHRISTRGIEVDKAKIKAIEKLPPPSSVKGTRSFLGHAGFCRRFIKDFSRIAKPLSSLLVQGTPFDFDDQCVQAFSVLKDRLVSDPIVVAPNWYIPFELMCDASDYAIGAVLGQKRERIFQVIHYSSYPHPPPPPRNPTGSFPGRLSESTMSPCSTARLPRNEVFQPLMRSSTSSSRIAAGRHFVHPLSPEWPQLCGNSTPICYSRSAPLFLSEASGSSLVPKQSTGFTACWMMTVQNVEPYLRTQTMNAGCRSSPRARACGNASHRRVTLPISRCTPSHQWLRPGTIFCA